jgi:hypothetical protein
MRASIDYLPVGGARTISSGLILDARYYSIDLVLAKADTRCSGRFSFQERAIERGINRIGGDSPEHKRHLGQC